MFESTVLLKNDGSMPEVPHLRVEVPKGAWIVQKDQPHLILTAPPKGILPLK